MITLTIDTCLKNSIIELKKNDKIYKLQLPQEMNTSENLLVKIEELLTQTSTSLNEINLLGVCEGPGSFTGVRVALSCAKGLLCGLKNLKLQSVNSFEKVAYINNITNSAIIILPSGNADLYYGVLNKNAKSCFDFSEYAYAPIEEIISLSNKNNFNIFALSEDKLELEPFVKDNMNSINFVSQIQSFCLVLEDKFLKFGSKDINSLAPLYIKQSQAERELKTLVQEKSEIKKPLMVQDLVDIENECFNVNKFSLKMFEEELKEPTREYFITYYKGKPIAYMALMIVGQEMNLLKIAVVPEFRGLKLAKKLLEKALEIKQNKKIEVFFLEVNVNNESAIKLYEKIGFKTKHVRKNYYENGDDCLVMFYEA